MHADLTYKLKTLKARFVRFPTSLKARGAAFEEKVSALIHSEFIP